jgi:tRNA (guanine-N7-)-methyltransferase
LARVRVRQHVNPLSSKYRQPLTLPDWNQVYSNLSQPFHLDLGCARGRFLLEMASLQPQINFLGIEIRQPLVKEANQLKDEQNLTNLYYLFANINNYLTEILNSLPVNNIELVMIQFPDPWFKKKHHKRRVVQPKIVEILANLLPNQAQVFLQSDVQEVAVEICNLFLANPYFQPLEGGIWLKENLLPIMTEREIATINKGEPVYRTLLVKNAE